ncbi:Uncharacterised protein [Nocardia otitidiscaviarum]|uniref:XRE family transcriptional regulator n=1 Tax=Nocardia otitidiscaviarum TaxID=1823 RepID=A0A379JLI2_9NOCA|nr:hypothetical protein [Nocardia otitidiscaviarum]SUD48853.1 Uncharacterised protein [Nocardia otitidiscaviarum]
MIGLDWTGVEVRCLREAMLCDYSKFAERIGCSERAVGKWESKGLHANLQPSSKRQLEDAYKRLDPAECQRFESALAGAGRIPAAAPLPARTRVVLAPDRPADLLSAVDSVRLVVDQTLAQCTVSPARVSLLDERVAQRIHEYTAMPPATALARIAPDLLEVQTIAAERQPATVQARLSEQSAVLGLLTADALMKLGEIDRASYWFGTARLAADDTPNLRLRARVRAQHAMLPYYYGDVATSVSLARKAQAILSDTTSDEAALAAAAEARALARLGDRQGAELAMNKAQRLTDALENSVGDEAFRFNTKRLMLYMSGTLTYMGHTTRARRVQDEALRLYKATSVVIDPALIHLDAAVGYAVDGSVEDGCQLAADVLESLPSEHRTRIVMTRGRDVLDALPASRQPSPAVGELRELLSADVAS